MDPISGFDPITDFIVEKVKFVFALKFEPSGVLVFKILLLVI